MSNAVRVVTRIQDQDDFSGTLTDGYFLKWDSGLSSFVLSQSSSPPGTLTVSTANTDDGSNHFHAITTSSNPGASASILATDANGLVQIDTDLLYVDAVNDRVGIGTSSPNGDGLNIDSTGTGSSTYPAPSANADDLVIHGSTVSGITLFATGNSFLYFGDVGSNRSGQIQYDHSNDSLIFNFQDVARFRIDETAGIRSQLPTGTANTIESVAVLSKSTTLSPAIGMGVGVTFELETSTTQFQEVARISGVWNDATHATRSGDIVLETVNNASALTEVVRIESDGDVQLSATNSEIYNTSGLVIQSTGNDLAFYGGTPAAKQTITGSRAGNAALASLLTALANIGLIIDSTS